MKTLQQNLADMVVFVAAVQAQSLSGAAQRLGMPVSTVSRRLASYEKRLNMPLLKRTTRHVQLAPAAKGYYEACLLTLSAAEQAAATLLQAPQEQILRLAMPVDLGVDVLAPMCAAFAIAHERLNLSVTLSAQPVDLLTEPFDMAIRIGKPSDERVIARPIGMIRSGIYAAPQLIKTLAPMGHPQDLAQWPCIDLQTGKGTMPWRMGVMHWPCAPGHVRLAASSVSFVRSLAEAGLGAALLPHHIARASIANGRLVQLLPHEATPQWPIYALTTSRHLSSSARTWLDAAARYLEKEYPQGL